MRILVDQHGVQKDYYDHIGFMYPDNHLTFDRKLELLEIPHQSSLKVKTIDDEDLYHFSTSIIGFCGRIIPFIQIRKTIKNKKDSFISSSTFELFNFYSWKDIEIFMEKENMPIKRYFGNYFKNSAKAHFSGVNQYKDFYKELLTKYPIFTIKAGICSSISMKVINKDNLWFPVFEKNGFKNSHNHRFICILNDGLFNIGFEEIVSAEEAYQELEMFLGKQNCIEKQVVIEEKIRIASKGFDKNSFRKTS